MKKLTISIFQFIEGKRSWFVMAHRWAGLTMALFLIIAGVTGSLLAFHEELDVLFAPRLHNVSESPLLNNAAPNVLKIRQQLQNSIGNNANVDYVPLEYKPGQTLRFLVSPNKDPVTLEIYELPYDEVFVHPYTGKIQGTRLQGQASLSPENWMPFIYRLHYTLALENAGLLLMGIIALVWTIDCFMGLYLTFPRAKPFFAKWKPAWAIKWKAAFIRINLDFHRATSLWLWSVLFIFAWSGVGFNLANSIYKPVMGTLFNMKQTDDVLSSREIDKPVIIGWEQALKLSRAHMSRLARQESFLIDKEISLQLNRDSRTYRYQIHSDRDIGERNNTSIVIEADTGRMLDYTLPTRVHSGETITEWLFALHRAQVFGLPYRVFVSAFGITVSMLSITGIIIWWKKRRGRNNNRRQILRSVAHRPG